MTEHRIPNWWVVTAIITGVALAGLNSRDAITFHLLLRGAGGFLIRMAGVCVGGFLLFLFRMIGAGDIKLAALMCGYLGMKSGLTAIGIGFLIGAVWSLLKMIVGGCLIQRVLHLAAYFRRIYHTRVITAYYDPAKDGYGPVIPLGVCFFAGCVVMAASGLA